MHGVIARGGERFTHRYFPETSLTSILNRMRDGSTVEVGTIGNEGMAGLVAYLEADADQSDTICQIAGTALRVSVPVLIAAANERPALQLLLNRFTQAYLIQVSQSAACNRLHSIEQRCARWLLMTHDRVDGAEVIQLKQEFLAVMLGVPRAGVTIAAGALQDAGLIRYRRGGIASSIARVWRLPRASATRSCVGSSTGCSVKQRRNNRDRGYVYAQSSAWYRVTMLSCC